MAVLKTKPRVKFDANNPRHVKAWMDMERYGKKSSEFSFDFDAPFLDAHSEARWIMAMAYAQMMAATHLEIFNVKDDLTQLNPPSVSEYRIEPFTRADFAKGSLDDSAGVGTVGPVITDIRKGLTLKGRVH
jgi:hypothetical protein